MIANLHPRVLFGDLVPALVAGGAASRQASARPGHDDDPSRAQRSAGLERRRRAAAVRLRASRAFVRRHGEDLHRGARRARCRPSPRWSSASRPRSIRRARRPGRHVLWVQVRVLPSQIRGDAAGSITGTRLGRRQRSLCRPRDRDHRALRAGLRRKHPRPRRALPRRSRARQSQSRRRRQPRRQSSPRSELFLPPGLRLVALPHADRTPLHGRRLDLARRRHRRRFGLHAGEDRSRALEHAAVDFSSAA